jgi:hypothetical protein
MFVWFRVPKVNDTTDMIKNKAIEKKVLLVPGGVCWGGKTRYSRQCAWYFLRNPCQSLRPLGRPRFAATGNVLAVCCLTRATLIVRGMGWQTKL